MIHTLIFCRVKIGIFGRKWERGKGKFFADLRIAILIILRKILPLYTIENDYIFIYQSKSENFTIKTHKKMPFLFF